ncbi:hypothetical protein [Devosia sp. XK-2]|uniref:tetratricopeptide repeat protein n=1 Tax=Devosia sp. XK-2 TaxID=3126689 RepID=UPI0030D39A91
MKYSKHKTEFRDDILEALDRICASEYFSEAEQIKRFLRYVVDEALAGRAERIKSYSVAVEALGKDTDFDPTQDPIVRITANRLRSALAKYYNESKDPHRVVIRLPKGHYYPEFDFSEPHDELPAAAPPAAPLVPVAAEPLRRWRLPTAVLAGVILTIAMLALWSRLSAADAKAGIGQVWIVVQELETGASTDSDFARILGDQIIAQMTRYDGVRIIDAGRAPNQQRSVDQTSGDGWTDQHVFSLATYVRLDDGWASVRWYLTDMQTNQVMWASDRTVGLESGDGAAAIVQAIAADLLGLEGAIPVILDRTQQGGLEEDSTCIARAQRNAFSDDIMLLNDVAGCLERVVRNHPKNGHAWALMSLALQRQARFAASKGEDSEIFRQRLQQAAQTASLLSPETFFPHLAQMAAAYDAGQVTALENLADRMLLRYSGDARLKVLIGKAFVSLGRPERGLPLIETGLQQIPSLGSQGYIMLALERYAAGDLEAALAYLNSQSLPKDYRYWLMKAVIYAGANQREPALQAWNALLAVKPGYDKNVCNDLRQANIHYTYFNRIVADLGKIVDDLPETACRVMAPQSALLQPDAEQPAAATLN